MSRAIPRTILWTTVAAIVAALAWAALAIDSLIRPAPEAVRDRWLLLPWILTLLALFGIFRLQRAGAFGDVSFAIVAAAMVATAIGQLAAAAGVSGLAWLSFPVGLVAWTIGMVLFGVSVVRAGVLPAWCGVAIALAEPLTMLTGLALSPIAPLHPYGSYTGALAHAVIWLAIGLTLWKEVSHARPAALRGHS